MIKKTYNIQKLLYMLHIILTYIVLKCRLSCLCPVTDYKVMQFVTVYICTKNMASGAKVNIKNCAAADTQYIFASRLI